VRIYCNPVEKRPLQLGNCEAGKKTPGRTGKTAKVIRSKSSSLPTTYNKEREGNAGKRKSFTRRGSYSNEPFIIAGKSPLENGGKP